MATWVTDNILRYNGMTGAFIGTFASGGGLLHPRGLVFGPDGHLYVSGVLSRNILRYNGTTGAFMAEFVPPGSGGLVRPFGLVFGPDGHLYVTATTSNVNAPSQVVRYNGTTGAFMNVCDPDNTAGLSTGTGLTFGPDGHLYVSSAENNRILRYDGTTCAFKDIFVPALSGGLNLPRFLIFTPEPEEVAADLFITKVDNPDPVLAGQILAYTITVTNNGPLPATAVTVTDTLPSGVTFVDARTSQSSCSGTSIVTCALGTLANGASATVTIVIRPSAAGLLTNTVSVKGGEFDPNTANNTAIADTTVNPAADLILTKADSPDPVLAGQILAYTITVTNNGPLPANNVELRDTLPSGVNLVSLSGGCLPSGPNLITCRLNTLASGASVPVTIQVRPTAPGTLTNTATVGGIEADPNPANNTATVTTTVTTPSQLVQLVVVIVQGQGTVTSAPAGIDCRPNCNAFYSLGTSVRLTATAAPGWRFDHWERDCVGATNACIVAMTGNRMVHAVFTRSR